MQWLPVTNIASKQLGYGKFPEIMHLKYDNIFPKFMIFTVLYENGYYFKTQNSQQILIQKFVLLIYQNIIKQNLIIIISQFSKIPLQIVLQNQSTIIQIMINSSLSHLLFWTHNLSDYIINYLQMSQALGNIRANRMIWTQSILIPGCLIYCFLQTTKHSHLPSVVEIAKTYPNCIVFRVGMLYSMFLMFLQTLFIHWWIQNAKQNLQIKKSIIPSLPLGLIAVISYAIFGSCIDTKRMNYGLIKLSSMVADISFTILIQAINKNIKTILEKDPNFVSGPSWRYKRILGKISLGLFISGVLIYLGVISIGYKQILQYATILTTVLYFWTFVFDFKKKYMGVQICHPATQVNQPQAPIENMYQESVLGNNISFEQNSYDGNQRVNQGMPRYPRHPGGQFRNNANNQVSPSVWREFGPAYPLMQE